MPEASRHALHGIQPRRSAGEGTIRTLSGLRVTLALLLAGFLAEGGAFAQSDAGADIRFHLRTSVDLVLVPVTVKDREGNLVTDLTREDFRLFENGEEQPIRYFSIDPFPLSAVILLDRGLRASAAKAVQKTLPTLASAFGPEDEFSLIVFDSFPRTVVEFTRDPEQLHLAFQGLAREPSSVPGATTGGPLSAGPRINTLPVDPSARSTLPQARKSVKNIHDALFAAALALRNRERGRRRVVFIVSDGRNSRLNVHGFKETRDLLLAADISVYAIGIDNARFALGTTVLSDYARVTGGDVYAPLKQAARERASTRIGEQARYQYTLVYAARPAPAGRTYRPIEVRVRRSGLTVRARDGYFAGVATR